MTTTPRLAAFGVAWFLGVWSMACFPGQRTLEDNAELQHLHDEDQADRAPANGAPIDWSHVKPRDAARLLRVKELLSTGRIRTATDYYRAAMVLQHGREPEDFLLAHELCVAAIVLGKNDKETRWLAAASEDRFMVHIDRPQRFGTQFHSDSGGPWKLRNVDTTFPDEIRAVMGTGSLAEAKEHEAELNRQ